VRVRVFSQIYDGDKKPEVLVDGWNVYFFDDLKALVSVLLSPDVFPSPALCRPLPICL